MPLYVYWMYNTVNNLEHLCCQILCGMSVQKKMDEMHPYHPLYKSEANYHK